MFQNKWEGIFIPRLRGIIWVPLYQPFKQTSEHPRRRLLFNPVLSGLCQRGPITTTLLKLGECVETAKQSPCWMTASTTSNLQRTCGCSELQPRHAHAGPVAGAVHWPNTLAFAVGKPVRIPSCLTNWLHVVHWKSNPERQLNTLIQYKFDKEP